MNLEIEIESIEELIELSEKLTQAQIDNAYADGISLIHVLEKLDKKVTLEEIDNHVRSIPIFLTWDKIQQYNNVRVFNTRNKEIGLIMNGPSLFNFEVFLNKTKLLVISTYLELYDVLKHFEPAVLKRIRVHYGRAIYSGAEIMRHKNYRWYVEYYNLERNQLIPILVSSAESLKNILTEQGIADITTVWDVRNGIYVGQFLSELVGKIKD